MVVVILRFECGLCVATVKDKSEVLHQSGLRSRFLLAAAISVGLSWAAPNCWARSLLRAV